MAQELGVQLNSIQIPPGGMERNPFASASNPGYVDAKKIKNLEVGTINVSTDGYIRSGKVSFNDTAAGFFLNNEGVNIGDINKAIKFKVADGSFTMTGITLSWDDITGTKPPVDATKGADWNSNLSNIPDSAKASYITSTKITATTIESPTISAGTITGATIRTNSTTYPYASMNSSGIQISGTGSLNFITTNGLSAGWIGGDSSQGMYLQNVYGNIRVASQSGDVNIESGGNIRLKSGAFITGNLIPSSNASYNIGTSTSLFSNLYGLNLSMDGGRYINVSNNYIQSNSQFRVVGSLNMTGNLTFENEASITINGRAYYQTPDPNAAGKYYLRS